VATTILVAERLRNRRFGKPSKCKRRRTIREATGDEIGQRLVEVNQQELGNLDRIITALEHDANAAEVADAGLTTPSTSSPRQCAGRKLRADRPRPPCAAWTPRGIPITCDALAREAGVSRSWLYTQAELRAEVERLRTKQRPSRRVPDRQRASGASLLTRLQITTERIRQLESTTPGSARRPPRPSANAAPPAAASQNATRRNDEFHR
jgi:hypothetical protein